jgi:hypothetical protein
MLDCPEYKTYYYIESPVPPGDSTYVLYSIDCECPCPPLRKYKLVYRYSRNVIIHPSPLLVSCGDYIKPPTITPTTPANPNPTTKPVTGLFAPSAPLALPLLVLPFPEFPF